MTKHIHKRVAGFTGIRKVNIILGCRNRYEISILRKILERHVWNFQGDIVNSKDTYLLDDKLDLEILWSTPSYYSYSGMLTDGACPEEGSIGGNL